MRDSSTTAAKSQTTRSSEVALLDVTDIKWKLYGKNVHFTMVQEAVVKIQAFARGALARTRMTERIQERIQQLLMDRQDALREAKELERIRRENLEWKREKELVEARR